ncbi:MAG: ATP-binding cassette domain-containing protein, partial [Candidatus Magnetomorum sp.]|nr:ATP-binding cassette domain-containing protein [Candidatus Magnetomorum sp.]
MKEIINHYSKDIRNYLLGTAACYGINLLTIILLVNVLVYILPQPPEFRYKIMFLSSLIMLYFTYCYARKKSVDITENILSEVREKIIENIRNCDLQSFEKIDKSGGYNAITLETQIFSESIEKMFHLIEEIFFTISTLVLILIVSPLSCWLVIEIICCSISIYSYYMLKAKKLIHEARNKERELFAATRDVVDGFKDLKLNDQKNDDFYHQCLKVKSADNRKLRIEAENLLIKSNVYSIIFEYCIFLPIVFILPYMGKITPDIMMVTMTLILFISFGSIKSVIPFIVKLGVSIERLIMLEETLKQLKKETSDSIPTQKIHTFKEIKYHNICFGYSDISDHSTFFLKNISFSIYPEEILFISGGNGSGKSTLLKVITGLYASSSGNVFINGNEIDITQYKYLFSAIFTDFHLFNRLYGVQQDIDQKKLKTLIEMMNLDQRLSYEDNRFTGLELSSGQKKRLALVISLMEDKPIYIFDEWAADQMPHFMDYFYYYLLPDLRKKGKSIIAVTHDDDYYHT